MARVSATLGHASSLIGALAHEAGLPRIGGRAVAQGFSEVEVPAVLAASPSNGDANFKSPRNATVIAALASSVSNFEREHCAEASLIRPSATFSHSPEEGEREKGITAQRLPHSPSPVAPLGAMGEGGRRPDEGSLRTDQSRKLSPAGLVPASHQEEGATVQESCAPAQPLPREGTGTARRHHGIQSPLSTKSPEASEDIQGAARRGIDHNDRAPSALPVGSHAAPPLDRAQAPARAFQPEPALARPGLHIGTLEIRIEAPPPPRPQAAPRVTPAFASNAVNRFNLRGR